MKQKNDFFTLDLLSDIPRVRPRKQNALSESERARRYRSKQRALKRFNFLDDVYQSNLEK